MNIGFVSDAITSNVTGVGRYARNIFNQFNQMGFPPTLIDWRDKKSLEDITGEKVKDPLIIKNPWPITKNVLWHFSLLNRLSRQGNLPDILFNPSQFVHPVGSVTTPMVYVVHDISFITYPECHKKGKKQLFQLFFRRTLEKADHIVCVTHYTKEQLLRYFPVSSSRVTVIHEGVEPHFRQIHNDQMRHDIRHRYQLPNQFLLYVGTIEPRKNLDQLLVALHLMKDRISLPLIIAGKEGWLTQSLFKLHNDLQLNDKVRFLGYVPDEDLPLLYNLATAFVYISKDEGFGLPPLEAMSCGTPVVASKAGALPEVIGDAALFTDHTNPLEIGQSLERICNDAALRDELSQKGIERASRYTWENTAKSLLALFTGIIEKSNRNGKTT
ncbi:MAG: glycosyltransferase family 4 protein [Proteobacteria bacterium]|nr:glycosyltransferase family 4 protein [Pseudomonadota bacterium]